MLKSSTGNAVYVLLFHIFVVVNFVVPGKLLILIVMMLELV